MLKTNKNYIVAILIIAVLTLSLFVSAVAVLAGRDNAYSGNVPAPSPMQNINIKDENGKVNAPITSGGTAISTAAELKTFLKGSDAMGYLVNNITGFKWDKSSGVIAGMSNIEFAKDRVLDGNGFTVTAGFDTGFTDGYPMITKASTVKLNWEYGMKSSEGISTSEMYATSFLIAVNQGTIKNLNLDVDIVPDSNFSCYEWIPSGNRNNINDTSSREANSQPLLFGFMTGVNFGTITNSTVHHKATSRFVISNANESSSKQWAKEDRNDLEFGGFAGINSGEISYVTSKMNGYINIQSRSSSKYATTGINSGNANARAIYGGIVGRMQSDPQAKHNTVNMTTALLTNSIVSGTGKAEIHSGRNGSGGTSYNHLGAAVGSNSPYSGTAVDQTRKQSFGVIDGIISSYTGEFALWSSDWESAGTTSGGRPAQPYRAIVDCGKISNVMFADAYDGNIDNCGCVGGEHIATRANGIKATYGDGNLTMSFSRESTSDAALVFEITPKASEAGKVDDNVIYAVSKKDRAVNDGTNITQGASVPLFNIDSEGYYSTISESIKQTSKKAIIEVVEPRAATDKNSYILELEFGTQVKAKYETLTSGQYMSHDEKLGREILTFGYDGREKGVAKISSLQDVGDADTFQENTRLRQFKSKFRSENQNLDEAIDYTMDLIYPGVYTDIYLQATASANHSYVDAALRIVAPLEKDSTGKIITSEFKITPVQIVANNSVNDVAIGGGNADKNDIDSSKLFNNTYANFDFGFSVFILGQSGERQEVKKTTSGSGDNAIVTYPYDRIEYSNDTYIFKTALTYQQFEAGEKFNVHTSTDPVNGRSYYFRAIKEVRDGNGVLKMSVAITLDSKNYKLKIDGEAPQISAKIVDGQNAGTDFMKWNDRNAWKKDVFSLEFNINEATIDGLAFYKKLEGASDNTHEEITLSDKKAVVPFDDGNVYVFYSVDKYGNRSKDYTVSAKIDSVTPEFGLHADMKSYSEGGIMSVDDIDVSAKTKVTTKVIADRSIKLSVEFTGIGASGATSYYKINNSEWILLKGGIIEISKIINPAYYNADGSVDKTIFDKIAIKAVSGSGIETISAADYLVQVNKGVILVDKDTITTVDGIFVTKGIRREHLTKTYTSNANLSEGLISILNKAINEELLVKYGESRDNDKKIYVQGYYATSNAGDNIPIILNVIDPLDVYTINANMLELKGFIAPALINVVVDSATREYGRANPKFTYTATGMFGSDTVNLDKFISAPDSVNLETPVNSAGISLNVPQKGYLEGNYRIGNVNSTNAKLYITPQELKEITYDDSYLNFAFSGEEHHVKGTYKTPSGIVKDLDVEYYKDGAKLAGAPIDIGNYMAKFTISDTNYSLDPARASISFEVHKGFVNIVVSDEELNLKFNGAERMIKPVLSNGSIPKITYYNDTNTLIHDGITGGYPITSGIYTIHVEYNNDIDADINKVGKYYNNLVIFTMTINKVHMAESGMKWKNVDKRFDGKLSQVIVSDIPVGTQIPEGLTPLDGQEGSYILLERTDVGEDSKTYSFKNPNIIEQELVAKIKIDKASFDDYNVKVDSLKVVFDNLPHTISLLNLPVGVAVDVKTTTGTTQGIEWDKATQSFTKTEAGTYRLKLQISNDNFVTKSVEAILEITKAKVTTAKAEPVQVKYDGESHYTIITGVPSDVDMESKTSIQIVFAEDNTKYYAVPMNAERTIWQTPSKVNTKLYIFNAIIINSNYEMGISVPGSINIQATTYKDYGTTLDDINVVYDGSEKVLQCGNLPDGTIFRDAKGNEISGIIRATDAGIYNMDIYLDNPNVQSTANHFKATLNISTKENTKEYKLDGITVDYEIGKTAQIIFDNGQLDAGFVVEFNPLDGMTINGNVLTFVNAGTYNIIGYVVNKNYSPKMVTAQVVINKIMAPYVAEIKINDQTVVFNGSQQAPTVEGLKDSDGATINVSYSGGIIIGGTPSNAGVYKASVRVSHKNYLDISKEIVFTIAPAVISGDGFMIDSASFVYDGNAHSVQVLDARGAPLSGYIANLTYGDLPVGELPINAGSYVVSGKLSRPNYQDIELTNLGSLDIRKAVSKELAIKDINAKFTGKAQKLNITTVDGESLSNYTVEIFKGDSILTGGIVDVGEYTCTIVVTQQNYTKKSLTVNVKIAVKEVNVTYENVANPVKEDAFVLKGTYVDSNGEKHDVIFDFPEGFKGAPGKYKIGVKIADANYAPSTETANVEFEIKGSNVGAIAGGAGGGAAVVVTGIVLFFVFKKKKISL